MVEDIAQWLDSLGLGQYAQAFAENGVELQHLPHLTDDDLKELGLPLGPRRHLQAAIETLPADQPSVRPVPPPSQEPEPQPAEAERRQLTVMFCDLVGSTALSQRLDPEDLREVMRRYQDAAAGAITRYEGYVAKFLGDGVLAYFGWPQAHEDQAERAVRAGLDAVAAVSKLKLDDNVALQARVGIATGLVVVGDLVGETAKDAEAVAGETPNLAARLQGVAAPGQVVIGATTRLLIGETFDLADLGAHELKGFAEPVHAWHVLREGDIDSRYEAKHVGGGLPLVGRQEELGLLLRSWEASKEGHGQVVLIQGEAGIGKSRLIEALREQVSGENYIRVAHWCSPYHANSTLYPVIEHLKRAMDWKPEDGAPEKLEKLEAGLEGQSLPPEEVVPLYAELMSLPLPEGRYAPLELSAKQQREQTLDALAGWLLEEAERTPVLNVWEDLHWADPTTLELLALYIEQSPTVSMLSVLTYRPEFVPPWSMHSHMTPITLNRLERLEVEALIGHQANGKAVPSEVVEHIVGKADGVPLYVEELTKSILGSEYLHEETDRYTLAGSLSEVAIPATLQDTLMARLDRLPGVRELAQLGAVLGREFAYQMLQYLAPLEEPVLQDGLGQLVANELLYQRGRPPRSRYIFRHALIQDAAYQSLLRRTRQQYHQQVAELMEEHFPETVEAHPELVAHHYGEAGCTEEAVAYYQKAGKIALGRSATVEAAAHLESGLQILLSLPESEERHRQELGIQLAMGSAMVAAHGFAALESGKTYERARDLCERLNDIRQLFPVLYGLCLFHLYAADLDAAQAASNRQLEMAEASGDRGLLFFAHRSAGVSSYPAGDLVGARKNLEQALALYDPDEHRSPAFVYALDPRVVCLDYLARTLFALGFVDQAIHNNDEAIAEARRIRHRISLAHPLFFGGTLRQLCGDREGVRERAEELMTLAEEEKFLFWSAGGTILRAWVEADAGDLESGIRGIREGIGEWQATGAEYMMPYFLALLAEMHIRSRHARDALPLLDEAVGRIERSGERWFEAEVHRITGEAYLTSDQRDEPRAEECFARALQVARAQNARLWQLRAAVSLGRLWRQQAKQTEAHDLLAPVHDWFTEGFDTPDVKEAKALLDELS